jgi:hypothetical protein
MSRDATLSVDSIQGFALNKPSSPLSPNHHPLAVTRTQFCMARKGASTAADAGAPRRSSRIKDQAKPEPPQKKAPAKPRSRKPKTTEEGDPAEKEKPKSAARGKKRTATEKDAEHTPPPANGEDAQPPAKKVRALCPTHDPRLIAY